MEYQGKNNVAIVANRLSPNSTACSPDSCAAGVEVNRSHRFASLLAALFVVPTLFISEIALGVCSPGELNGPTGQRTFIPGEVLTLCEDPPDAPPNIYSHTSFVVSAGFPFPGPYDYSNALLSCSVGKVGTYTGTGTEVSVCFLVEAGQADPGFLHPEAFGITPIPTFNVPVVRFISCNINDTARLNNQAMGCQATQWTWTNPETCQSGGARDPATGACLPPPAPQDDKGSGNGTPSEPPNDLSPSSPADAVPHPSSAPCQVGNPCNPANGNKYQLETDYRAPATGVSLARAYNSMFHQDVGFGFGWISSVQARLEISSTDPSSVQVRRSDGRGEPFTCGTSVGACQGNADTLLTLTKDASGYLLTRAQGVGERYDNSGRLTERTEASGERLAYGYDSQGRIATVTGPFGHALNFAYDATGHVSIVTDPAGQTLGYNYDANGNLIRVTYPDGSFKTYYYEDAKYPYHLTGITDENGVRFATFGYDFYTGRANLTQHAVTDNGGPQERFTLGYIGTTEARVQDAIGTEQILTFQTNLGVKTLLSQRNSIDPKALTQTSDVNNNVTCRRDEEGRVTTYQYNATNQFTSLTEGQAGDCINPVSTDATRTTTYQYLSANLNLPTVIQGPSVAMGQTKQTIIQYTDPNHPTLPTVITQNGFTPSGAPISRSTGFGYNSTGQVSTINGPRTDVNDVTTLEYYNCITGNACGKLRRLVNALGQATTYDSYDAHGHVTQITDPNGLRTNYAYDLRGRARFITQTPPAGLARTTEYRYDAAEQLQTAITPDGVTLTYVYDAAHYLRSVTDNLGNRIAYHYDLKGNRDRVDITDPYGTLARTVSYTYDLRNHVSSISPGEIASSQFHDALGNLVQENDANRNVPTFYSYDALNRLRQTIDRLNGVTGYAYDLQNNVTVVQSPNGTTSQYVYDDLGNRLQEISPDRGATAYTHDAAGNVVSRLDARGVLVNYHYDALNRVTSIDYPGTAEDVSFIYDIGPACSFGTRRLCGQTDASGTTTYGYDAFGNITSQTRTVGSASIGFQYTYDTGDRILAITYPDGSVITYLRDAMGRLSGINRTAGGATAALLTGRQYQADGLMTAQIFGNGLAESRAYDLRGLLLNQSLGTVDTRQYMYDLNGNLVRIPDPANPEFSLGAYSYDRLDRLTFIGAGSESGKSFSYDKNGNRLADIQGNYTYISGTNLINYVLYDNAGNILDDGNGNTYTYNNAGRLAQALVNGALVATYTYNAPGQRTQKTLPNGMNVLYHYSPAGQLLAETDAQGRLLQAYVLADDQPIARINYDQDYDGVPDSVDNCLNVANPNQRDTNNDGYGNLCDPDLNNDGLVNNTDLNLMKAVFYTSNADADLNGDGYVNFGDLAILKSLFGKAPGPSGLKGQAGPPTVVYLYTDYLGNLRLATDPTGKVAWSLPLNAFGDAAPNEDLDGDGKKTTIHWRGLGLYADSETSLLYNGARYRDPKRNRFLTPDSRSVAEHVQRKLANLGAPDQPPVELNPYVAVGNNPLRWVDPTGLTTITYNATAGTVTVMSAGGAEGTYPAANNAASTSNGPFSLGTFPYSYYSPHTGSDANSAFGSYGNFIFDVPGRTGMGVHSGRANSCDRAGRCGVEYATEGCIRTTDEATEAIRRLHQGGDPVTSITVIR